MSETIIKVEQLGKLYKLGEIGTGTISHDLNRWWAKMRGREDPFLKIGEMNDRTTKGSSDYVWALKDTSFEVKQGDVMGIIGSNGAGKSTLLKILSKVTTPTSGLIKIKGRIASLLEVGTGFHPELTGRENIFLNGAILGMSKAEIKSKFDEIVDFAGVERYIDTPVKRYSSGMYVRLAFAVAAFLEPEILIVDEVLAVGDAEFQDKCLGRMQNISENDGRTILFVSHNMTSIQKLCKRAILLKDGCVHIDGNVNEVVQTYNYLNSVHFVEKQKAGNSILKSAAISSIKEWREKGEFGYNIELEFTINENQVKENVGIDVTISHKDCKLIYLSSAYYDKIVIDQNVKKVKCIIGPINLAIGLYDVKVDIVIPGKKYLEEYPSYLRFEIDKHITEAQSTYEHQLSVGQEIGLIAPFQKWSTL